MNSAPFDCPDCDLTVKHHHPKPMLLMTPEQLLQRLAATAPRIDPSLEAPSLEALLAGTEFADALRDPARHEVVVELYDGIALSMKCVPCRARIPIRPERAAARLVDLNELAHEHTGRPDTANQRAAEVLDQVAEELLGYGDTAPSKQQVHLAAWLQATADNLRGASSREPS